MKIDYELKRNIGWVIDRKLESQGQVAVPEGTVIVSADTHLTVAQDLWYDRFPEHMKDRAPRVWLENGAWQIGKNGETFFPELTRRIMGKFDIDGMNMNDPELRQAELAAEGVQKELAFGNNTLVLLKYPDFEVRELIFKIYNEYLAECQQKAPGKFYGVGLTNFWDPEKARESIQHIKSIGLKTYMLPYKPGKDQTGADINYMSPQFDVLWTAAEEAGLPICFHVGETFQDGPGGMGVGSVLNFNNTFREVIAQLIFGGIFDRHPGLKCVFAESQINWVPGLIQDMEMIYGSFNTLMYPQLKHPPRYYWENHCYAIFMTDPIGMRLLDLIGADRIMWSSDYPHLESTYGYGWTAIQEVLDFAPSEEAARMILGGTAMELFDLQ